ncbi:Rid family detoxifying hydrolase [Sanyastnella coralliicola]|uniref:Rid family detoxifying hydrolase n=1 Tax=Sanyastnella coralliicola TaxID=3069118 RepID=UPI0027BA3B23|nr:Rid family detoxifying hydrolase [Longitalea sp. SCSIO 12813]
MKEIITTSGAPAPIGPYNQAVKFGDFLFVSGQIALDAGSGELMNSSIQEEATKVMSNLEAVLEAAGYSVRDILKTSIFLSDMDLFNEVNAIYASYFESDFPARETVAVKGLPKGVNVEISVIAAKQ